MKIRTGFVSNSSSSSFVIYGVHLDSYTDVESLTKRLFTEDELKDYDNDIWELIYSRKFEEKCGFDVLTDDGSCWFGKIISTSSDSYMDEGEMSFEEIVETRDKLKELFPELESKIYAGERAC